MTKPTILVAEDDPAIRLVVSQTLTASGYAVRATASTEALARWVRDGEGDVVVTDVYLGEDPVFDVMPALRQERPDLPIIVMSGQNTILTAASAAEQGAFDYLPKPFDIDDLTTLVTRALKKPKGTRRISRELKRAERDAGLPLIGRSDAMQEIYRAISRVMNTDLAVLIQGEAGVGKELAARAIHTLGARAAQPFVYADLSADRRQIDMQLSELGRGIFYVDEVGDLSDTEQSRLITVSRQLGDAQLVAATRHDLGARVREGTFRQDLYYRLSVMSLNMPPLRARKEDIPELAKAFLLKGQEQGLPVRTLDPGAVDLLTAYDWPGNVRELENLIMRLSVMCPDAAITDADVEQALQTSLPASADTANSFEQDMADTIRQHVMTQLIAASKNDEGRVYQGVIEAVERPLIELALSVTSNNKVRAAALLGLNRNTLRSKINGLGLADE